MVDATAAARHLVDRACHLWDVPQVKDLAELVVTELVSNVVRHAHASRMSVVLVLRDGLAELVVGDDGVGFTPGTAARKLSEGHIGVDSQRLKVEAAGGRFEIDGPAGAGGAVGAGGAGGAGSAGGTTVRVTLPASHRADQRPARG
jgi:signal transduction histidine kinase